MASTSNLGRVQGGGFFGSTSTSTTSIATNTVKIGKVKPLVGDTIVNANGDLLTVTAVGTSAYTVTKYGNIKGAQGPAGSADKQYTWFVSIYGNDTRTSAGNVPILRGILGTYNIHFSFQSPLNPNEISVTTVDDLLLVLGSTFAFYTAEAGSGAVGIGASITIPATGYIECPEVTYDDLIHGIKGATRPAISTCPTCIACNIIVDSQKTQLYDGIMAVRYKNIKSHIDDKYAILHLSAASAAQYITKISVTPSKISDFNYPDE